jgi:hypothetical protein
MAGLASINIKFKADLSGFSTEMQTALRQIDKAGKQFQAIGRQMSTFVTLPLLAAGGAAIKFASDYNESMNKVDVAFGGASESVKSFAKTSLESFGISAGTALDMAATFGDMGTSLGLSTSQAAKMSTSLVGLAGDLSSFKNISIDIANTALNGIFTGETESLKKLGIVMTEAALQNFAYSKGMKVKIQDMDQASKVQLRYAYIMSVTKNSQGDFTRTSGGAANQMRIFTESLKQVAQQFGTIMLPLFTKAITFINKLITSFGNLSEGTKTTILVVAGIAAILGPLALAIGAVLAVIPSVVAGFALISASIIPIIAGATLLFGAFMILKDSTKTAAEGTDKLLEAQSSLNSALKKGNEEAANEVGSLDKLYASATNVKVSIDERKKAVNELQSLYPAYFNNIKDEAILNGSATKSYNLLRDAIFNKSRANAIDGELQARANDRIKTEIKLREDITKTEEEIIRLKKGSNEIVLQEGSRAEKTLRVTVSKSDAIAAQTKLLEIQNKSLKKYNEDNLKADSVLFSAKEDYLKKSIGLQENEKQKLDQVKIGTDAVAASNEKLVKSGTIAFYESQIDSFKKFQKEQVTSNALWVEYQQKIDTAQKSIDAISNTKIKFSKPQVDNTVVETPTIDNSLQSLNDQKSYYEGLRSQFSTTAQEYKNYTETINGIQLKINKIEGVEENVAALGLMKLMTDDFAASQQRLAEIGMAVGGAVADAFSSLASGVVDALGLASTGFEGFIKGLVGTITKLIAMMLASSISQSIAGAVSSGTATGPAAIFTTPAFIATAVGGVLSAFAAIPRFEVGGVVGGSSYYGDKVLARVNSGELILNQNQQKNLYGQLGSSSSVIIPSVEIKGQDLLLVFDRANSRKNRVG